MVVMEGEVALHHIRGGIVQKGLSGLRNMSRDKCPDPDCTPDCLPCTILFTFFLSTKNARTENAAPSKMQGWKTREWKMRHQCVGCGKCGTECYGTPKLQ